MFIKKLFIALIAISSLSACNKVLDVNPESQLDANLRFQNLEDYSFSLLGTYSLFRSTSYYGSFDGAANAYVTLPDMLADNLLSNPLENLNNEIVFSNWLYTSAENQIEETWKAAYRIISQANMTLNGIDRFADKEPGKVNRIKSQALAIRALVHFDILRYWVSDYSRNSTKPGIPFISEFNYEVKPSRGTVAETYNKIEKDLLDAKGLMADMDIDINPASQRAYIDEMAVNALLARMYLYSKEYDKAIEYATAVIDNVDLADKARFDLIWEDAVVNEVLWSVTFNAGQGQPGGNVYSPAVNRSQYEPNPDLVAAYDQEDDVRLNAYFKVIPTNDGDDRLVLAKYLAKTASLTKPDGVVNFKALRVSEMYLIRAEAYARSAAPNETAAMDDLNALRDARIYDYVPESLSGQPLLDAIELERRKELVAEGHRFFDLKRGGADVNRTVNCSVCELPSDSPKWTWPIPRAEIDANPAIKPQNDGYGE